MNRLQEAWVWLRRIGHCRGFGIQSPTDYRFVRYVVNEHWPYYAYQETGTGDSRQRRKLGQLYFRLANHLQPAMIVDMLGYDDYLKAGCRRAVITHKQEITGTPQLIIASASHLPTLSSQALPQALVVEGIGQQRQTWDNVLNNPLVTVTFDLYYCGIAFFDPQRTKQNYVINF